MYSKTGSSMHEFMKKKEEIHASFDVTLQAAEVMAIVHG